MEEERIRILLVEDDDADRRAVERLVERKQLPYSLVFAVSVAEAIATLDEGELDLALIDHNLPDGSGLEVQAQAGDLPCIFITGEVDTAIAVEAMKAGAYNFLVKDPEGVSLRLLPTVIDAALEHRRTWEALRQHQDHLEELVEERTLDLVRLNDQLLQEIAEHRKAEEGQRTALAEALQATQALREERNLLRTLIDALPDLIHFKDTESRFIIANQAVANFLGAETVQEIIGKRGSDFFPQEVADQYRAGEQAVIQSGQPLVIQAELSTDPAGNSAWFTTIKVPLRDIQGRIIGLVGMSRDITEQRRGQEERERLQAQLIQAQRMEAFGLLAGGVAHDFNNLLTPIIGYSQLLAGRMASDDPHYHQIQEILAAGRRAASLTRQLLLFSRREIAQPRVLNLNEVMANLEPMLGRLISEDVQLITCPEPELRRVKADPGQIEQVIMNLVLNARDALTRDGRITVQTQNVTFDQTSVLPAAEGARAGSFVCLSVADNGVGMDAEIIEHIFEPFFTTKAEGTGLGLSVVFGVVQQHEGWITVDSVVGEGSTFKVYLPARPAGAAIETRETVQFAELKGHGEGVLVVEDEEVVLNFVDLILRSSGYTVFTASTMGEALSAFEATGADSRLLFSDMVLPDGSGLELVEELQSRKEDLRVLLCSGYTDDRSQLSLIQQRGFQFIQKPYSVTQLLQAIGEALA